MTMTNYVPYKPSYMLKQVFHRVTTTGGHSDADADGLVGLPLFRDWDTYEAQLSTWGLTQLLTWFAQDV